MAEMTTEQFGEIVKNLPEDADLNKVARALGYKIPALPLDEQLAEAKVLTHKGQETKRNPNPKEKTYVAIPSLKFDDEGGSKGFWVNTRVARSVANRILAVCDDNDL